MNKNTKIIIALMTVALALASCNRLGNKGSVPATKILFVRGFVVVPVNSFAANERAKQREISLPNASVFLVRLNDQSKPIASAQTDLSGRFAIKTEEKGIFTLCVEAEGFRRFCSAAEFTLDTASKTYGNIRLPLPRNEKTANAYGEVKLLEGDVARRFEPAMDVNVYARIELETPSGRNWKGYVNNFGEYVVPGIPVDENFKLNAFIENEKLEKAIDKLTAFSPNRDYRIDFVLPNAAPKIRVISQISGGQRAQIVSPGSAVVLKAVTEDRNRDKLEYRWQLPDGSVMGPTTNPELTWNAPAAEGQYAFVALVSDKRGGYVRDTHTVTVTAGGVIFSGTVVDTAGALVNTADIDINGKATATDGNGHFRIEVPVKDRYVLNIRHSLGAPAQPAFAPASYVYTGAIIEGRWIVRRAMVADMDPTQPIVLQHKRGERDCVGSRSSQIDWGPYLQPGLFEWQDGRGNVLSLKEKGLQDPKGVASVIRSLSRINAQLPKTFAQATGKGGLTDGNDYKRVNCLPGIKVEIPPNSLEDPITKMAPVGNVAVAVSGVDLTSGDQMPGDYTAVDTNGKFLGMESFGAGSVEITGNGKRFNLKPGTQAVVTIPVDATQQVGGAIPAPTIPFLYYDEPNGVWRQDGVASLSGSGASAAYVKKVKHFSTMNADILKSGQSCVAVEVDPAAGFVLPLDVEVTMPPSVVNPTVIQVRHLSVDTAKTNAIYNLPNNTNIVLTPLIPGVKPDGSSGNVPAGIFVVNTGGPQSSAVTPPPPNPDGSYYAEAGGVPTGPCGSRVTLKKLTVPSLGSGLEFLQGFHLDASNISEFSGTVAANIVQGATDYYAHSDPRGKRASFNLFKSENKFGQPLGVNEVEFDAQYSNSGDLGFGRDMHCRRNVGVGGFDYACYVTNYGQPPTFNPDQLDADNAFAHTGANATVTMEFSRVENLAGDPTEFPDNKRAVKFYVYDTANPNSAPIKQADLDGFGDRPVPQLCVICHGGQVASVPADIANPAGPKKGAFANRNDILAMRSNFLPFDLHYFNFPAAKIKGVQQTAFKNLNIEIVQKVSSDKKTQDATDTTGDALVELINTLYNNGVSGTQLEDAVIPGWDPVNTTSNPHRLYRDVFARACRTCHAAQPLGAPSFQTQASFDTQISSVQNRVCNQKIMPHAKRTNDIFWTSLEPNMPAFLQLYGETQAGWNNTTPAAQCGLFFQGGNNVFSKFTNEIYPILSGECTGCHSAVGNANFAVGNVTDTYNSIMTATAKDGISKYIVPTNLAGSLLYQRMTTGSVCNSTGCRMPRGGDLTGHDGDGDGVTDTNEIRDWILSGAGGP